MCTNQESIYCNTFFTAASDFPNHVLQYVELHCSQTKPYCPPAAQAHNRCHSADLELDHFLGKRDRCNEGDDKDVIGGRWEKEGEPIGCFRSECRFLAVRYHVIETSFNGKMINLSVSIKPSALISSEWLCQRIIIFCILRFWIIKSVWEGLISLINWLFFRWN